jgi:uncharacterized membrane protein
VLKITLAQGHSVVTMLAVALAAIAVAGLFYWRALAMLPARRWLLLLALRSAAVVIVVLLLFRPVLSYYADLGRRPGLVLLLDRSASMSIADDATGVTRFNQARRPLEKWWDKLAANFDLHVLEFAEQARPVEGLQELARLTPDGPATSLSRALLAASKQVPSGKAEAIIMLSDGIHNSAGDPAEVVKTLGTVVHTIGVGASLRSNVAYHDVQVSGIDCPAHMMLNNMARVTGSIQGVGLTGRVVKVLLEEDGRTIQQSELTLEQGEGPQQVVFQFRPQSKGRHNYTVRVPPLPEEKIVENNQRSANALVTEPGIRVLYLEGTLRAEYGAIVDRFLAKDPDLEFCALVQTKPNVFARRTNIAGLELAVIPSDQPTVDKFDVFILGDLDSSYIRTGPQEMIVRRIRAGAGLLMLGGHHSLGPGGYAGTPLGQILPVMLGGTPPAGTEQLTEPFLPVLTPEGVRHPIFANISDFFPTRQGEAKAPGLMKLDGCTRVAGARPAASVLATVSADAGAMPVLAVQPVGQGRAAVFCGDTTRNWQQASRALDQQSPFLRFWGQMVRWLGGHEAPVAQAARIEAATDKAAYKPEESIGISAVVRDKEGQAATAARVVARVRGPGGRPEQVQLSAEAGPGGHYRGTFEPQEPGGYEFTVEAVLGNLTLTADKISVSVGRPNLEFENLDLDQHRLAQIAAAAGGRYVHITAADALFDQLDRGLHKRQTYIERQLYWPPLCWALFVTALSLEWILRRRFLLR